MLGIVIILIPLALITLTILRDATAMAYRLQQRRDVLLDPTPATPLDRTLQRVSRYVDIDRVRSEQYIAEQLGSLSGVPARGTPPVAPATPQAPVTVHAAPSRRATRRERPRLAEPSAPVRRSVSTGSPGAFSFAQ